jgi:AcrR family transcriptional regulator
MASRRTSPEGPFAPTLRADAERNRMLVLAAAREVHAQQGLEAPTNQIARRAGVATLGRRFPTREDLITPPSRRR